jgi:hypothetical protein
VATFRGRSTWTLAGMESSFLVLWYALLVAPPVAGATYYAATRWCPAFYRRIATICVVYALMVAAALLFHLRLSPRALEVSCLAAAYFALCFLVMLCFRIRRLGLRIIGTVVAAVPVAIGYALGTVGGFLLALMVDDWTRAPQHVERISPGLECRVATWGSAVGDDGYTVHLLRIWRLAPFIEREVATIVVDETDPQGGPSQASCSDAAKLYSS